MYMPYPSVYINTQVGCTSLIVLFFVTMGLLPDTMVTMDREKISTSMLQELVTNNSLGSFPKQERNNAITTYFKFVMYRDPLERLASAYRSKVQHYPLIGLNQSTPHYNWFRAKIYQHVNPQGYQQWMQDGSQEPINLSFRDFVEFWLTTDDYRSNKDPHFVSFFQLCEPCRVRYSYYGDFDNFQEETNILVRQMGTTSHLLREGYRTATNQSKFDITRSLYDELEPRQKAGVLEKLSKDIDFYYHLFPEKIDSHKRILDMDIELPTPPV